MGGGFRNYERFARRAPWDKRARFRSKTNLSGGIFSRRAEAQITGAIMATNPKLTAAEWRAIQRVLPPSGGVGRPRHDDRRAVTELLYFEALARMPFSSVTLHGLHGRSRAGFLSVKRQRWLESGTWQRVVDAGRPALSRWRRQQWRGDSDTDRVMRAIARQWG